MITGVNKDIAKVSTNKEQPASSIYETLIQECWSDLITLSSSFFAPSPLLPFSLSFSCHTTFLTLLPLMVCNLASHFFPPISFYSLDHSSLARSSMRRVSLRTYCHCGTEKRKRKQKQQTTTTRKPKKDMKKCSCEFQMDCRWWISNILERWRILAIFCWRLENCCEEIHKH